MASINPNLTSGVNLSDACPLPENRGRSMLGIQKSGPFDVDGVTARAWLALALNPNGRPNADVLRPYWNGDDLTARPRDVWFIDLPRGRNQQEASLFEAPFHHILTASYDGNDANAGTLREVRQGARDFYAQRQ